VARKRLRPFLDEVISDADLRSSAERVAAAPAPTAPPALSLAASEVDPAAAPRPAAFPPAPWEEATAVTGAPDAAVASPGNGSAPAHPPIPVESPPVPTLVVAEPEPDGVTPVEPPPHGAPSPRAAGTHEVGAAVLVGAAAESALTARRRRRSASLLPPLPSPTDIPEDAAGRVTIFSVPGPAIAPPPSGDHAHTAPDVTPAPVVPVGGDAPLAGWVPVLALGVILVIVFVIGVLVTR
jgi:hypothetical protein